MSIKFHRVKNGACNNGFKVGYFGRRGWVFYPLAVLWC